MLTADDIRSMVDGLSPATIGLIRTLKEELISAVIATPRENLAPKPHLILNALRLCPIENVKIVLVGQDPYINGEATGLSFSVPREAKIPPSLRNIYKCLQHCDLIKEVPTHGDLSEWARRGVLLLNVSLTTRLGKSNAHPGIWTPFTTGIIKALPNRVYILLGNMAKELQSIIASDHVFTWGHPSPLSTVNQTDNPWNFIYCDAFTRATDVTGMDWNVDAPTTSLTVTPTTSLTVTPTTSLTVTPTTSLTAELTAEHTVMPTTVLTVAPTAVLTVAPTAVLTVAPTTVMPADQRLVKCGPNDPYVRGSIYIATDGACTGNGTANCRASYAYYATDGTCYIEFAAPVVGKQSNNTGELTAILEGLKIAERCTGTLPIVILTDSEYSMKCICTWYPAWVKKGKLAGKQNIELIRECVEITARIQKVRKCTYEHINSHVDIEKAPDRTKWAMNDRVDKLAVKALAM
jgi:uracil-DNA glycosylase